MKRLRDETGQSVAEFAIVLPILLLIVCAIIDFGWVFYNQLSLQNCVREGARYGAVNAANTECISMTSTKINQVAVDSIKESMTVSITFTSPQTPCDGDIVVTVKSKIRILTPVLGVFYNHQEKEIVYTVTMKAES